MGRKYNFDYTIIGSGPAGSAAALTLAKSKKRIALVEGRFFGGTHLNTRDVPYEVALNSSHTYSKISYYPELSSSDLSFSFPTMVARQLQTIRNVGGNNHQVFETAGITCINGYANFLDQHTIAVGEQKLTSHNFILATGSKLKVSEISGLDAVNYLTPETAIKTRRLPKAVLVVGGGPTGCEIATYFAELGTKVLILETAERLLPREDKDVSIALSNYFTEQLGIMVLTSSKVVALEQDSLSKRVIFQNGRSEKMVRVDCIVLATGSEPILDYGLENAAVKFTNSGIKANKHFETSAKNIYAIGDCLGQESSTERATYEGALLAANLLNKTKTPANYLGFTRQINTSPAVAIVGFSEEDLLLRDRKYRKSIINLGDTLAGKVNNLEYSFVKLLANPKSDYLFGACIVAPNANLLVEEIALALRHHLTALDIASTPHIENSYNYAIKLAAQNLITKTKK